MNKFYLFAFLFGFQSSSAQNPLVKQWDARFGGIDDEGLLSLQQTIDTGFILGGYSESGSGGDKTQPSWGGNDYWIVKTDPSGIKLWDKRFGGLQHDYLTCLQQTADTGYILGGYSESGTGGDKTQPSWGQEDYWMVKTDALGNLQWNKRFGGTKEDQCYSIQQTTDGGYILGGYSLSGLNGDKSQGTWGGSRDYWIVKTDSLGNMLWNRRFGGTDEDELYCLSQTTDGGYILGGHSYSGISGNKTQPSWGCSDYWIVKTDSLGNFEWDARFGGSEYDFLRSLQQTSDKGYILGGYSNSEISGDKTQNSWGGSHDYWIVKTDSLGIKQWDKRYGGNDIEHDLGNITQTYDEGYLVGGTSYSGISGNKTENNLGTEQTWIVKTDSLGNMQWDKTVFTVAHDEIGFAIQSTDGCYVMANQTEGGIGGYKSQDSWDSHTDYWLVKFCDTSIVLTLLQSGFSSIENSGCPGTCFDFINTSINATSYQWLFPGGNPSSSVLQNPTDICYANSGVYDVILIASTASAADTLTLGGYIMIFTPPSVSISQNGPILTSNPASSSYQWFWNGNVIPNSNTQSISIDQPGTYTIEIIDSNGCTAADTLIVTSIPSNNLASSDTLVCEKFCINFFDASTNNPTSWLWQFPGGTPSSSTDQNPTGICYNNPGTYDVTLITINQYGTDTLSFTNYITVYPTPPVPTIAQNGNTLTSSPADFYQWQFNTVNIPGATNQSYTINQTGFYTIVVSDTNDCFAATTIYIDITSMENLFSDLRLSVYPNPSDGVFTIEVSDILKSEPIMISIMNTLGQKILTSEERIGSDPSIKEIIANTLPNGQYFIEIKSNHIFVKKKIIIIK